MTKDKRTPLKMTSGTIDEQEDLLTQELCDLVQALSRHPNAAPARDQAAELRRIIKRCLLQKNDDILYDALERLKENDERAWRFLKSQLEEDAATVFQRRDAATMLEVNAFVIPLFTRTQGGLDATQAFQDQAAFEQLTASLQQGGLESPKARVVLINHAYHLDEVDSITYSHLHHMVRDAAASLTDKKVSATPEIERSIVGWPDKTFAADDVAVELRYLLGFALKTTTDPFYKLPTDEAAADAWFDDRARRFQAWTESAAPLAARCLMTDGRAVEINFLYQDLFHGGKETGMAEYFMLQMMAELNQALQQHAIAPATAHAVIGPAGSEDDQVLRVNLYGGGTDALLVSTEKPIAPDRGLQLDIDDTCDALQTLGITRIAVARDFDADGNAQETTPWTA
jgi:hypothetical protein